MDECPQGSWFCGPSCTEVCSPCYTSRNLTLVILSKGGILGSLMRLFCSASDFCILVFIFDLPIIVMLGQFKR